MNRRILAVLLLGFIGHEACVSQITTDIKAKLQASGGTSTQYFPLPEAKDGWRSMGSFYMSLIVVFLVQSWGCGPNKPEVFVFGQTEHHDTGTNERCTFH